MAALEFSRSDVEDLVDKLVAVGLSGPEQALLLAIFLVAAEGVAPVAPQGSPDLGDLRGQLINSFLPDPGDDQPNPGDEFVMIYRRRRIGMYPHI